MKQVEAGRAMKRLQIAVLARAPVAGESKTRLIPHLGADRAARLQAALTRRALRRACALPGAEVTLWVAGPIDHPFIAASRREFAIEVRMQPDGDLGARMLSAISHGTISGAATLVIGTDCPAQTVDDLAAARTALADYQLVLQPAQDGGYVLIGMHEPVPSLFADIAWGTGHVFEMTRSRARSCSMSTVVLRTVPDLDRPEDLDLALAAGWIDATEFE